MTVPSTWGVLRAAAGCLHSSPANPSSSGNRGLCWTTGSAGPKSTCFVPGWRQTCRAPKDQSQTTWSGGISPVIASAPGRPLRQLQRGEAQSLVQQPSPYHRGHRCHPARSRAQWLLWASTGRPWKSSLLTDASLRCGGEFPHLWRERCGRVVIAGLCEQRCSGTSST